MKWSALLQLMRPRQWVKNSFVFAPLGFSLQFLDPAAWIGPLKATGVFILASSTVYILNDVLDREEDRQHPMKRQRPLASGAVKGDEALFLAASLLGISGVMVLTLPQECWAVWCIYLLLNLAYSFGFKRVAVLDVMCIASGFVLRVLMGGFALDVPVSPWIILTTFLLALFLALAKRYHEIGIAGYTEARRGLHAYSRELLDRLMLVACVAAFMSYAIYAVEMSRIKEHNGMVYTTGFVAFGLFRYLQRVYVEREGGEPESILFRDRIFLLNLIAWLTVTLWFLAG